MGTGGEIFHQALAFTYNDLTPNILKVRDREVCAYQSNGATADSLRSCHPLSEWMEKPAVQVVYLAWFYMVSLAGCILWSGVLLSECIFGYTTGFEEYIYYQCTSFVKRATVLRILHAGRS